MSAELCIGDGVGLVSEGGTEANGTVVDFVYAAHAPCDESSLVRVYWRTSGAATDHLAHHLVRLT